MAAPVVSGAIACLLSKYPFLTNAEVKLKLHASCVQIPGTESGWGILDFSRLLDKFLPLHIFITTNKFLISHFLFLRIL